MFHMVLRMRVESRLRRATKLCVAAALAVALGGCASNMTGFDFPSFGLIGKSDPGQSALPPEYQPTARLGQ